MIPNEKLEEIRTSLKKSVNPLFFFDDDCDGVCSFLLLKKFIDKGNGVIVKHSPILDVEYERKIKEYSPDIIFVLDKPIITQNFVDKVNVPLIWLDHHPIIEIKGLHYYNPRLENKNDERPTSYWCYQITKQNLWLGTLGCIADSFVPEFAKDFMKIYPDLLLKNIKTAYDAYFNTKLGKLIKIINFNLKGKTSEAMKSVNILAKIEDPYEILDQTTPKGKFIFRKAEKLDEKYNKLLEKALKCKPKGKLFVFLYNAEKISFSVDLANELNYKLPYEVIMVGGEKEDRVKMSLRSKTVVLPKIIENALKDVQGSGGGHDHACGSNINKIDFDKFIENIRKQL